MSEKKALLIIDIQNDFCPPHGSLKVEDGLAVIPVINNLRHQVNWDLAVATQDHHPAKHSSFYTTHQHDPNARLLQPYRLSNGTMQVLWPDHCVQGTKGAELHAQLRLQPNDPVVPKGTNINIDSYSGFFDNDHKNQTELDHILKRAGITTVYVTGLAYDFCVGYTALDAKRLGYNTYVIEDAARGISQQGIQQMKETLKEAGVKIITSHDLLNSQSSAQHQAVQYLEQHNIPVLFQKLTTQLIYLKPEDPIRFIIQSLQNMQENNLNVFDEKDIETLFHLMDPLKRGVINRDQLASAFSALGIRNKINLIPQSSMSFTLAQFITLAKEALQ